MLKLFLLAIATRVVQMVATSLGQMLGSMFVRSVFSY